MGEINSKKSILRQGDWLMTYCILEKYKDSGY